MAELKVIYKYQLAVVSEQQIVMPLGAKILSVQAQRDTMCIWAMINPREEETQERTFFVEGTGQEFDLLPNMVFIGICQVSQFVWHIWEAT